MTTEISNIIILLLLTIVAVVLVLFLLLRQKYRKLEVENRRQKDLFNRMDNQKIAHFHRA